MVLANTISVSVKSKTSTRMPCVSCELLCVVVHSHDVPLGRHSSHHLSALERQIRSIWFLPSKATQLLAKHSLEKCGVLVYHSEHRPMAHFNNMDKYRKKSLGLHNHNLMDEDDECTESDRKSRANMQISNEDQDTLQDLITLIEDTKKLTSAESWEDCDTDSNHSSPIISHNVDLHTSTSNTTFTSLIGCYRGQRMHKHSGYACIVMV